MSCLPPIKLMVGKSTHKKMGMNGGWFIAIPTLYHILSHFFDGWYISYTIVISYTHHWIILSHFFDILIWLLVCPKKKRNRTETLFQAATWICCARACRFLLQTSTHGILWHPTWNLQILIVWGLNGHNGYFKALTSIEKIQWPFQSLKRP